MTLAEVRAELDLLSAQNKARMALLEAVLSSRPQRGDLVELREDSGWVLGPLADSPAVALTEVTPLQAADLEEIREDMEKWRGQVLTAVREVLAEAYLPAIPA